MKTLWNKQTGKPELFESVDAREVMALSPDLYSETDPKDGDPKDPDKDGLEGAPQNVANIENEFRREPVGDNPPAKERDQTIIRNPVTDEPRMAMPRGADARSPVMASAIAAGREPVTRAEAVQASKAEAEGEAKSGEPQPTAEGEAQPAPADDATRGFKAISRKKP